MPEARRPWRPSACSFATRAALLDEGLPAQEREHRRRTLEAIEQRLEKTGPRRAEPSPDRAVQFMPFAALRGLEELLRDEEEPCEQRRPLTADVAAQLDALLRSARPGDELALLLWRDGRHVPVRGPLQWADAERGRLCVAGVVVAAGEVEGIL